MVLDNRNKVDPTVQAIVEMFPEDFLRNTARETGVVERERKIEYYQGAKTEIRGKSENHIEHK
jgi:hypothetical protein